MFGPVRFWPERFFSRPERCERKMRPRLLSMERLRECAGQAVRWVTASSCWDLKGCIPEK
jgi:hypothetical protein